MTTDAGEFINKSDIPIFYKECILAFQELKRISGLRNENEIIWCNSRYTCNGKPLAYQHWSKNGIKNIQDIYINGIIDEGAIKQKLSNRSNFFFEIYKLKKALPRTNKPNNLPIISSETDEKDTLLKAGFKVPQQGIKTLEELSSRDIYNIFLLSTLPEIKSKGYWRCKLNVTDPDWDSWYKANLTNPLTPRKAKDFNWKVFHGLVNHEARLKLMNYSKDGFCKVCKNNITENLEHMLFSCNNSITIWNKTETIINKWLTEIGENNIRINKSVVLSYAHINNPDNISFIINTVISIVRFHMWKIRNRIRYDSENISLYKNFKILQGTIVEHIKILQISNKDKPEGDIFLKLKRTWENSEVA